MRPFVLASAIVAAAGLSACSGGSSGSGASGNTADSGVAAYIVCKPGDVGPCKSFINWSGWVCRR